MAISEAVTGSGDTPTGGLSRTQAVGKRGFDMVVAALGLTLTFWLIGAAWLAATLDSGANGFFTQQRVGRGGRRFTVVKLRTMRPTPERGTTITRAGDPRITRVGRFLRRTKLDELPQLWNVLKGDMSFVGPRPDVPGYADKLKGDEKLLLSVRPGITGPATLAYRDEEAILAEQDCPERYNDEIIYPDKVRINLEYIRNWRFRDDLRYIWQTLFD
ncbi:sugar transferase [Salinisphaera aquimarina]|uniref:Sugar transferase n=1 Tax=Salinisphaera aquimarina TaxID=2094031 RepID=A0ABV7EWG5_9GAMM